MSELIKSTENDAVSAKKNPTPSQIVQKGKWSVVFFPILFAAYAEKQQLWWTCLDFSLITYLILKPTVSLDQRAYGYFAKISVGMGDRRYHLIISDDHFHLSSD